jgi:DNA replication protein DnaC
MPSRNDAGRQPRAGTELHDHDLILRAQLAALCLPFIGEHHQVLAQTAAEKHWSHLDYLSELATGETAAREDRRVRRRIKDARFPVLKTLDQFDWNWPTRINRLQLQNLMHLDFVANHGNVVFISATGLGKSHLMTALGHAACLRGHSVLFTGAIDIVNSLAAAQAALGGIKRAMDRYVKPQVLCIDELGYLPIDKFGADCLFQILSHRYEHGATLITTNRVYKQWAGIFNNDSVLTSALLDRLVHHAETVFIEGKSYRTKDRIEP